MHLLAFPNQPTPPLRSENVKCSFDWRGESFPIRFCVRQCVKVIIEFVIWPVNRRTHTFIFTYRLFGTTGYCAACSKVIPAFEMVMRAKSNVYHLECFACQQCNHRYVSNNKLSIKVCVFARYM